MPTTTTKTTNTLNWTDSEGTATAIIETTDAENPVLVSYVILDNSGISLLARLSPTTAQITFINTVFTDLNSALNPSEES